MNDYEIVKECLDIILKKGDLYDAIAEREGVKFQKHSFIRNHIFLFSRILYGGVRLAEKMKSLFSPIEEVKEAQDKIRSILGVNVDFVKTKHIFNLYLDGVDYAISEAPLKYERSKHPILSILYENPNIRIEEYVEHLKKILSFCELYKIEEVFLRESDITTSFPGLNLEDYKHVSTKTMLDCYSMQLSTIENDIEDEKSNNYYDFDKFFSSEMLLLDRSQLRSLIGQLEVVKISKKLVRNLGRQIEDIPVRNAIREFLVNGDLEKLKGVINSRLTLLLNSDSSYKDREYGKVFKNILIKEEYIKIVSINQKGEIISNTVTTLYDYLEVLDYSSILKHIKMKDDDRELFAMTALHLYLCQRVNVKSTNYHNISFYDYVYNNFKAKKSGKVKKIPGLYKKDDKICKSCYHAFSNILITIILAFVIMLTGTSANFIAQIAFGKGSDDILTNMAETVLAPYVESYNFEKSLVENLFGVIEEIKIDFSDWLKSFNGDSSEGVLNNDTVLATINQLGDKELPTYFATGYADSATYSNGQMEYSMERPIVDISDFGNVHSEFEVSIFMNKTTLASIVSGNEFQFPMIYYPLGSGYYTTNYVLTEIYIYDVKTDSKVFVVDGYRLSITGNRITGAEMELLNSLNDFKLVYVYGIDYGMNPYIESLDKSGVYTENEPEVIRQAIIEGLGLSSNATDSQIYAAILSKDYSITPIKDAGLTRKIKKLDEQEYFETIASLDSLICNLAATLAVGTDEELVYTVGYYNSEDNFIRANEGHAWALSNDGTLIDITPSDNEEDSEKNEIIQKIIEWGIKNHIPLYALIGFVGYSINKLLGKKVRFYFNIRKTEKILTDPDIEESYARLKESLYGGLNIPCKRPPSELLEAIKKEFGGFTLEELKAIREELLNSDFNGDGELDSALKLLKQAPFLKENSNKVKQLLKRKYESSEK